MSTFWWWIKFNISVESGKRYDESRNPQTLRGSIYPSICKILNFVQTWTCFSYHFIILLWLAPTKTAACLKKWLQLLFDGRSTAYQRSLRSQWRNPLSAVSHGDLFIYLFRPKCSSPRQVDLYDRNVGRRMVVHGRIAVASR